MNRNHIVLCGSEVHTPSVQSHVLSAFSPQACFDDYLITCTLMSSAFLFQTKSLPRHTGNRAKHFSSYLDVDVGHEHSEVGQVCA